MKSDITITPAAGDIEGFNYRLTIFSPEIGSPDHQSVIYDKLSDIESVLTEAGWPEVADRAGKTLELGHEFTNTIDVSPEQKQRLLRRGESMR
jgi:hypothetical protein